MPRTSKGREGGRDLREKWSGFYINMKMLMLDKENIDKSKKQGTKDNEL
jgi:hypothetical protein